MTFEGSNPDIISGITAPMVWLAYGRGMIGNGGLLIWNVACLVCYSTSSFRPSFPPLPLFQQFAFDQPNAAVLKAPFVLLPSFIVPAVLFAHVAAIMKIERSSAFLADYTL